MSVIPGNKSVYFDMFSGASGDMILGALLDSGLPLDDLMQGLSSLEMGGYSIKMEKVRRGAVTATLARVLISEEIKQPHRSYKDIAGLISSSRLKSGAKKKALAIFKALGEAEAKIHGLKLEEVHFHEVGAVDSIVDIVGSAIGFDLLGITHFYSSPFPVAGGMVNCRHGGLPLPAPAALELIARAEAPIVKPPHEAMEGRELVTPTGAAIITTLASFNRPEFRLNSIGYGAGLHDFKDCPNVLRLWVGEVIETEKSQEQGLVLLETNIDDMNPQIYDHVMEKVFSTGALDVWLTPIQMKKNRPGVLFSVLAPADLEHILTGVILNETTTLGIRARPVMRHAAERESMQFQSSLGKVSVKIKRLRGEVIGITPEYEDCKKIASLREMPLKAVYRVVENEAAEFLNK